MENRDELEIVLEKQNLKWKKAEKIVENRTEFRKTLCELPLHRKVEEDGL